MFRRTRRLSQHSLGCSQNSLFVTSHGDLDILLIVVRIRGLEVCASRVLVRSDRSRERAIYNNKPSSDHQQARRQHRPVQVQWRQARYDGGAPRVARAGGPSASFSGARPASWRPSVARSPPPQPAAGLRPLALPPVPATTRGRGWPPSPRAAAGPVPGWAAHHTARLRGEPPPASDTTRWALAAPGYRPAR